MRNLTNSMSIKKSIVMTFNEYAKIIKKITLNYINADCDIDGIVYQNASGEIENEDFIIELLCDYFCVKVTSVHLDDCSLCGVWVTFTE